ncbi:Zn-dependent exopeptidase M28 [Candidatus Bipolaricaulota bacterium]|nr:Zn-dependent exopeptidase M28 [Candidatus Bipolaricaulota bacterium]
MNAMDHVRYLAEHIGARGSTTLEEKEAATYVEKRLTSFGAPPTTETFRSARSAWLPAALFWSITLASGFVFLAGGRLRAIIALALAVFGLVSILLELLFRPNPLRWILPKGDSQNVWARIEAEEEAREHVALVAHMDTHRTPLVFSSRTWVRLFERLVPIGMGFAILLIVIFAVGIVLPMPILGAVALGPMFVATIMLILMLQADFTSYAAGANDNASGVGVALSLAEKLAKSPLKHTKVWIVLTGCEEVGCYGADDFICKHKRDLGNAAWISLDTIGSFRGSPVFLSQETFLATSKSDEGLLDVMRSVATAHPELGAREIRMKGSYTDGAMGFKHGLRALTLESHQQDGTLSNWHQPTDTINAVFPECIQATESLVFEFLQQLDRNVRPDPTQSSTG